MTDDDLGIDAIAVEDGRLILVQAKVFGGGRTPPKVIPASEVEAWFAERTEEWSSRPIPGLVGVEGPSEHVLEVLVGHPSVSFLVWHVGFDELECSVGTVEQPDDLAFDYGGHRTTPYANAAVPPAVAAEAVAEFVANGGQRPTVVDWKEPEFR